MPIASFKPEINTNIIVEKPKINTKDYKGIVIDNKQTPLISLIAYIEGMPWQVTYYQQIIGEHNDLKELDASQSNVYQQYNKVNNLEIRVDNPLTVSQDQETSTVSSTGSAVVYPFLTPSVGDVFIASTFECRLSLFRVTSVERKSFNRLTAYLIEYDLVGFLSKDNDRYKDLENKVIRNYYFNKDRLVAGLSPILLTEDHEYLLDLNSSYSDMVTYYFRNFYSNKHGTLVIPGQKKPVYDSFLVKYLLAITSINDAKEVVKIKDISIDEDVYLSQPQLWSCMLNRSNENLPYLNKYMGLVNIYTFATLPTLPTIRFSGIDFLLYPITNLNHVDPESRSDIVINNDLDVFYNILVDVQPKPISREKLVRVESHTGNLNEILDDSTSVINEKTPLIYPVLYDSCYVLSKNFYNNTDSKSILEKLVFDYLTQAPIDIKSLILVIKQYRHWGLLEQFYYIPLLMTLIKISKTEMYI